MANEQSGRHRNDTYGDNIAARDGGEPAIPAATVVLLRDQASQLEVLMLHKASQIAFGGMWVFPGGRIDDEDYDVSRDANVAARNAAVRETLEEAGLALSSDGFVWFAHWTPPPGTPKRYATWFFAARADSHDVTIDGGEIQNHQWLNAGAALERHAAGEIDLAPPTWVTLYQLHEDGERRRRAGTAAFARTALLRNACGEARRRRSRCDVARRRGVPGTHRLAPRRTSGSYASRTRWVRFDSRRRWACSPDAL